MCLKALSNAMTRREFETTENKRLIEKQSRFSSMIKGLREQGAPEENIKEVRSHSLRTKKWRASTVNLG